MDSQKAIEFLKDLFPGKTVSVQETVWYHRTSDKVDAPEFCLSVHGFWKTDDCALGFGKTLGLAIGDLLDKTSEEVKF